MAQAGVGMVGAVFGSCKTVWMHLPVELKATEARLAMWYLGRRQGPTGISAFAKFWRSIDCTVALISEARCVTFPTSGRESFPSQVSTHFHNGERSVAPHRYPAERAYKGGHRSLPFQEECGSNNTAAKVVPFQATPTHASHRA